MNQTVTTFDTTYGLSTYENSGLIILQSKIFEKFSTTPSVNSFHLILVIFYMKIQLKITPIFMGLYSYLPYYLSQKF